MDCGHNKHLNLTHNYYDMYSLCRTGEDYGNSVYGY